MKAYAKKMAHSHTKRERELKRRTETYMQGGTGGGRGHRVGPIRSR